MFKFKLKYFLLTLLLFATELIIATYTHDRFIRPFVGDFLVVIFIYCFVKSFINTSVNATAISVLLFSFAVETSQYFHLIDVLGWRKSLAAKLILGTSFAWNDIVAYTLGILLVLLVEKWVN